MTNLIEISNLSYRPDPFPPGKPDILQHIDLNIEAGEFIAIIGRNGSGKTTLIKHINGLLFPTKGKVSVAGLDTSKIENLPRLRALVGMVFQNPADQIVASTVEEDIAFGLENLNLPPEEIQRRVAEQIQLADLAAEAKRPPHLLSGGQIQRLALAGVLGRQPEVLLFDEPTSMLDPLTRNSFLDRICNLHKQGLTIIYITHHMEEAVLADRLVVLDQGKLVRDGKPDEIFREYNYLYEIGLETPEAAAFGRKFQEIGWAIPEDILTPEDLLKALPTHNNGSQLNNSLKSDREPGQVIIDVQDIYYTYLAGTPLAAKALRGASLQAAKRKIQGIAGTNGSGKSTLLQHLNGILRPSQGKVRIDNLAVEKPDTNLRDVVKKVGLVFQNPETQFFEIYVGDEIAFGPKQFELDNIRERVRKAMETVGLDFEAFKDRRLDTLSGGEKRKVALASTLVLDQEILLFDEPTAGMDPQSRDDLLRLFTQLISQGKTILIASHRLDELAEISAELSIMKSGKVLETSETGHLMFNQERLRESGLCAPLIVKIVQNLIENGWPLDPTKCLRADQLFDTLEGATT